MYSGSTLTAYSGHILGAHQKINRLARKQFEQLLPNTPFPSTRQILHFEGDNGPDGIKRKSPAKDEPWHFMQPFDEKDVQLIEHVESHYRNLVKALKEEDAVRAAFEAAWLSHAIVDGLTPAHHYPYEEKLVELSSGRGGNDTRTTIGKKLIMPGESTGHKISNNWKMWGPKGLFTTHAAFEWGVAMLIIPLRVSRCIPSPDKIDQFKAMSLGQWFRGAAQDIARLELYDTFYTTGWTIGLARRARNQLAPAIVQAVTIVWYGAATEAGLISPKKL
jgi:hypothetical protein